MMTVKIIRSNMLAYLGKKIIIVYYGSRNRKERYEGVLLKLYYNIFTIKLKSGEIKSFGYKDILTKTIQIYTQSY